MRKTFDIPNELLGSVDTCPAVVLDCSDFRMRRSDNQFVEEFLISSGMEPNFDSYTWPGGHKDILDVSTFRMRFLELLNRVSVKHHSAGCLIILMHWDCLAFGGLQDEALIRQQLVRALDYLRPTLPAEVEIVLAYSKPIPDHPGILRYTVV